MFFCVLSVECSVKRLEGLLNDTKPKSNVWDIRMLMALRQHKQAGVSVGDCILC